VCRASTPRTFEYSCRAFVPRAAGWITVAVWRPLLPPHTRSRTRAPRRVRSCHVATCRGARHERTRRKLSRLVRARSRAVAPARAKFPRFCRRSTPSRVSDMFDSPERSEDYRDMFATPTREPEGRRPSGAAGRPRAASRASQPPGEKRKTAGLPDAPMDEPHQRESKRAGRERRQFCPTAVDPQGVRGG